MARFLAWFGAGGTVLGLVCCLTPLLPVVLGGIGANGLISVLYRDSVLLPFAGASFVMLCLGLVMLRRAQ